MRRLVFYYNESDDSSESSHSSSYESSDGDRYDTNIRYTVNLFSGVQKNGKRLVLSSYTNVAKLQLDLPVYADSRKLMGAVRKIIKTKEKDEINKQKRIYNKKNKVHVHIGKTKIDRVLIGNFVDNSDDEDSWTPEEPWSTSNSE